MSVWKGWLIVRGCVYVFQGRTPELLCDEWLFVMGRWRSMLEMSGTEWGLPRGKMYRLRGSDDTCWKVGKEFMLGERENGNPATTWDCMLICSLWVMSVKMYWNAAHGICQHLFAYYCSLWLAICPMNGKKVLVQTEGQASLQIYSGHCRVN